MRKFSKFIHKALWSTNPNRNIDSALTVAEALYSCARLPQSTVPMGCNVDPEMGLYFKRGVEEYSDICDAFEQSHRIETHILPRSYYIDDHYDTEVRVLFYRAGETKPLYRISAALAADGQLVFQTRETADDFVRKSQIVGIVCLTKGQLVEMSTHESLDIGLPDDEVLRVRYAGTLNAGYPRGCDYFLIQHFKQNRQMSSSVQIAVSPYYQYVAAIGYGLVLHPGKKSVIKDFPFSRQAERCLEWNVRKFDKREWPKDVPVKPLHELRSAA